MAGLDTSIALGIKPVDFGDPNEGRMNALRAQMMQMQMQQGQFNMMKAQRDMQYQDQQRARAAAEAARQKAKEEAARREFMTAYGATGNVNVPIPAQVAEPGAASDVGMLGSQNAMPEYKPSSMMMEQPKDLRAATNALIQGGKFDAANLGMGYGTAVTKAEKEKVELGKAKSEATKVDAEAIDKNLGTFRSFASTVNSPEAAAAYTSALFDHPVLGDVAQKISGQTKDQAIAAAMRDYATDPQRWMAAHVGLKGEEIMKALSAGGGDDTKGIPITNDRGDVIIVNPKTGQQIGDTLTGAGKQGGTFAKAQASRANAIRDMDAAIPELKALIEPGSILDKSTASGAGALADSAMAFFGKSTEGAQAAAALKPIADRFLKMVPRFEGPQSDKDVVSYKTAAADLANETLPVATRRAAAKTLLRLTEARRGQFGYSDEEAVPGLYSPNQSGSGQAPQSGPYAPGTRAPVGGNPYASKSDAEIKAALGIKD
jgi:hypothetical protein